MMQYRFTVVLIITIYLALCKNQSDAAIFHNRGNMDIFNLLLGLYKLNPLKGSNVYKTFSSKMLNHGPKLHATYEPYIHEVKNHSQSTMKQVNDIEQLIHPKKHKGPLHHDMVKPQYDVEDVDIEKFDVNLILNEDIEDQNNSKMELDDFDISENIFEPTKNEISNDIPVTKLIPVNDSRISNKMANTKLVPKRLNIKKKLETWGMEISNSIMDAPLQIDNRVAPNVFVV